MLEKCVAAVLGLAAAMVAFLTVAVVGMATLKIAVWLLIVLGLLP